MWEIRCLSLRCVDIRYQRELPCVGFVGFPWFVGFVEFVGFLELRLLSTLSTHLCQIRERAILTDMFAVVWFRSNMAFFWCMYCLSNQACCFYMSMGQECKRDRYKREPEERQTAITNRKSSTDIYFVILYLFIMVFSNDLFQLQTSCVSLSSQDKVINLCSSTLLSQYIQSYTKSKWLFVC